MEIKIGIGIKKYGPPKRAVHQTNKPKLPLTGILKDTSKIKVIVSYTLL